MTIVVAAGAAANWRVRASVDNMCMCVALLRSVSMLDTVAIAAVRQRQSAPTFNNRRPVEVVMTVPIIFELPQ